MKPYLLILALMTSYLNAAAPAFPNRHWKADTPGLTLLKDVSYDNAITTIEVTASDKAVIPVFIDAEPNVGTHSYALMGEVKYEKVAARAFLKRGQALVLTRPSPDHWMNTAPWRSSRGRTRGVSSCYR